MKKPLPLPKRISKTVLERLRKRKMTNAEAAEHYGVSVTYLSRVVAAMQDKVPGPVRQSRAANAAIYAQRKRTRETLAKAVARGDKGLEKAAEQANCSVRTMRRYVAQYVA
jgi:hypothetical protein